VLRQRLDVRIQWIHEPEPPWNSSRIGLPEPSPQTCHISARHSHGNATARDVADRLDVFGGGAPSGILGTAE
jgi:hypothetical protein